MGEIEELSREEIIDMFGASIFKIEANSVKNMGELAELTKRGGRGLMRRGGFKLNGVKITDPEEKFSLDDGRLLIKNEFTVLCWGKRKFSLIRWIR